MSDDFLDKIIGIEKRLKELKNQLQEIPKNRKLVCTNEWIKSNPLTYIYRPRFRPKEKPIPQEVKKKYLQIIDDINFNLKKYSPDNFTNIQDIIDFAPENKKSIVFLLEKDVYPTDEVYGDYLVEKHNDHYELYYHRWDEKKKKLPDQNLTIDLEYFINNDAINQIQNRFDQLWEILKNEVERCKNYYLLQKESQNAEKLNQIKSLLKTKECEFLDFKKNMYKIFSKDNRTKLEQRKEFLKDVLGLVNNKRMEEIIGKAYIIIGIDEENQKYNGVHQNINFTNYQTLIYLVNEYISPKLEIEFVEFYISGNESNILISKGMKQGYDRILVIKLSYEIGTVYEIKKEIGNPIIKIEYYRKGTSFTRDGSHTRYITQEDREKLMNLAKKLIPYDYETEDFEEENISTQELIEKSPEPQIDKKLIKKYITMLKTKELSKKSIIELLQSISGEIRKLEIYDTIDKETINLLNEFVKFSFYFIQNRENEILTKIFYMLRELTSIPEMIESIREYCLVSFVKTYKKGNRNTHLINILNNCGYFENIVDVIIKAIREKDITLLGIINNFNFEDKKIIASKYSIIEKLIDEKEKLDFIKDNNLIQHIQQIIRKIEKLK